MTLALSPESLLKGYYYLAWFATIIFVIKLAIYAVAGGGSEVFGDFNTETDTDCSFNFLSIQSILSFMMGFGWMGFAGIRQFGFSQLMNFGVAFAVGLIFMIVNASLMFAVKKLEKNVKKDKATALNQIGKAYTNFEPHGLGQIEVVINGQLSVVNATNKSDERINSFDSVKVTEVSNDMLYIEKVK